MNAALLDAGSKEVFAAEFSTRRSRVFHVRTILHYNPAIEAKTNRKPLKMRNRQYIWRCPSYCNRHGRRKEFFPVWWH